MTEYSPIKVISKELVSTFFDKDLKCSRLQYITPTTWFSAGAAMARLVGNMIPGTDILRIIQSNLI